MTDRVLWRTSSFRLLIEKKERSLWKNSWPFLKGSLSVGKKDAVAASTMIGTSLPA